MKFNIRFATQSDMPKVLELIKELAVFEKEPDAVIVTEKDLIEHGFGKNPLFTCFVAEKEEEIVAIALIYFRFSTWKGKTVHLEDLIVKQEFRVHYCLMRLLNTVTVKVYNVYVGKF